MYVPVASQIYSEGSMKELRRTYQIITKWIFSVTAPFFLLVFLFPEIALYVFGANYVGASNALRLLALGYMFHVAMGLNGASLIVVGGGKLLMYMTLIGALSNVALNTILIPMYGITGAALATSSSYILANLSASLKLFKISGIQPFTRNYLKSLLMFIAFLALMSLINPNKNLIVVGLTFIAYNLAYLVFIILSKSIDFEDVELLQALEKRLGINLWIIRKILRI